VSYTFEGYGSTVATISSHRYVTFSSVIGTLPHVIVRDKNTK
jgi:hypothetical protein